MKRVLLLCLFLGLTTTLYGQTYTVNVQLTIDSTAGGVQFTASDIRSGNGHPQVNSASCTNNSSGGAFRYTVDGSSPTTTVGVEVPEGGALVFNNTQALLNFKAIRTGGSSAVLSCTFSQLSNVPPVYPVGAGGGGGSSGGDVNITEVAGTPIVGANVPVDCVAGCTASTSDADDGSIAAGQTNSNANALGMAFDGTVWRRVTFGVAGTASAQVTTVQGIASMTPLLATVSDGSGALNTIVDSGTLTAVTTITNPVTVTDGAGALNTIVDSGTLTTVSTLTGGGVAAGAADSGNPLKVGGVYNSTLPTLDDGDRGNHQLTVGGALIVAPSLTGAFATDATSDSAALTTGPMVMGLAAATGALPTAVTAGDAVRWSQTLQGVGYVRLPDPCSDEALKVYFPVDIVTATTTEIVNASASNYFRLCSINLVSAGANNIAIVEDDSDTCASPTAGLNGGVTAGEGWNIGSNGGMSVGSGMASVMKTAATNRYVCIITSAAVQLSGTVVYTLSP